MLILLPKQLQEKFALEPLWCCLSFPWDSGRLRVLERDQGIASFSWTACAPVLTETFACYSHQLFLKCCCSLQGISSQFSVGAEKFHWSELGIRGVLQCSGEGSCCSCVVEVAASVSAWTKLSPDFAVSTHTLHHGLVRAFSAVNLRNMKRFVMVTLGNTCIFPFHSQQSKRRGANHSKGAWSTLLWILPLQGIPWLPSELSTHIFTRCFLPYLRRFGKRYDRGSGQPLGISFQ